MAKRYDDSIKSDIYAYICAYGGSFPIKYSTILDVNIQEARILKSDCSARVANDRQINRKHEF